MVSYFLALPNQPTLTGPSVVKYGSTNEWTCISTGGKPAPTMTMRIGNSMFTSGTASKTVLQSDNTYTVSSVLSWSPSMAYHGQSLYCDVQYQEAGETDLKTDSLLLTIYCT